MSRIRDIVITDNSGGEVTLTAANNVPVEVVDSNGLNLDLTAQSNVPVAVKDAAGLELALTANINLPIEVKNEDGGAVNVQHPFPTNGDSVYAKDIWVAESVTTDWIDTDATGEDIALIPFTNLHTRITNSTATNPKILTIHFNRSVFAEQVGLGCTGIGDFSNVVVKLLGSDGAERTLQDESANSTKYSSRNYRFDKQLFNALTLEFHTADPVCLSNITVQKVTGVSVNQVEQTTNSLQVMQYSHAELHSGNHYLYRDFHTIAKAGVKDHLAVTPDTTRWAHMTVGIEAITSTITVEVYEDTVTAADGTLANTKNRNRNFPDNNTTLFYEDPTIVTPGTLITALVLGAGKGSPGGAVRDSEEILLKQNTKYLLRVTEANIVATIVNFNFDWYEHTNLGG